MVKQMRKILLIAVICTLIDQVIKFIVTSNLNFGESFSIINNFFSITLLQNTGAAFSILSSGTLILILISLVALNLIYWFLIRGKILTKLENFVYGILIGGILGNLIDRVFHGYVIDYLDFQIFNYNFPVFNFADICIVVTIFLIIILILKGEKNARKGK